MLQVTDIRIDTTFSQYTELTLIDKDCGVYNVQVLTEDVENYVSTNMKFSHHAKCMHLDFLFSETDGVYIELTGQGMNTVNEIPTISDGHFRNKKPYFIEVDGQDFVFSGYKFE